MDASPSIGLLNLNGILASNERFVPVLADFLSYHGLKILFETLSTIEEDFDFIFDRSGDVMLLFAKDEYDVTALVLEKLKLK